MRFDFVSISPESEAFFRLHKIFGLSSGHVQTTPTKEIHPVRTATTNPARHRIDITRAAPIKISAARARLRRLSCTFFPKAQQSAAMRFTSGTLNSRRSPTLCAVVSGRSVFSSAVGTYVPQHSQKRASSARFAPHFLHIIYSLPFPVPDRSIPDVCPPARKE